MVQWFDHIQEHIFRDISVFSIYMKDIEDKFQENERREIQDIQARA